MLIQVEQHFFTSLSLSLVLGLVNCDQCCLLFWPALYLLITWPGAKISPGFFFCVRSPWGAWSRWIECIAGSFGVNRSTICCHQHRLSERRKNNDRLGSEWTPTDISCEPVCVLIFAVKSNIHFINGNLTVCTSEMRLRVILVPYVLRNYLVFLQDSAPHFTATACSEYLQLA